jgi:hypothetical protein
MMEADIGEDDGRNKGIWIEDEDIENDVKSYQETPDINHMLEGRCRNVKRG